MKIITDSVQNHAGFSSLYKTVNNHGLIKIKKTPKAFIIWDNVMSILWDSILEFTKDEKNNRN